MSWANVPLGKCCEIVSGATPRRNVPDYWGGDIAWATPKDISGIEGAILFDTPEHISKAGYKSCSARILPKNSILFSSKAPIGLVAIAGREMCTNQRFKSLIPGPDVDSTYLYYCMKKYANRIETLGSGATFKVVSKEKISKFQIPLPSLKEQKRIAAILDKADAISRKRRQAIKLADEFSRSVFLDMFGDPAINQKGWERKKIRKFAKVVTGNTPSRQIPENYGDHIEWIKSDNINTLSHILTRAEEGLSRTGEKIGRTVPANSTLVTCIAGSPECIGNAALSDRKVAFNQQINAIVPFDYVDPYFLYMLVLMSKKIIQRASTNSMKGMVSKGIFQEIELISPPYNLQKKFGSYFYTYLNHIDKKEIQLKESDNLFNSLCQKAFRGEL